MPAMEKVAAIVDGNVRFIREVNADIAQLNNLIDFYNHLSGRDLKLSQLQKIYRLSKEIDDKYPDQRMSESPSYRKAMHVNLYNSFIKECTNLGISMRALSDSPEVIRGPMQVSEMSSVPAVYSLSDFPSPAPTEAIAPVVPSFAELFAKMDPKKVDGLLETLSSPISFNPDGYRTILGKLYGDEHSEEAEAFRIFLQNHSIKYLGGGNAKNFQITQRLGGLSLVLKIDDRLDAPKDAEEGLRSGELKGVLSPIYAERHASYKNKDGQTITRRLLLTDYYPGGNLLAHAEKEIGDDDCFRLPSALKLYTQMAEIVTKVAIDGCVFPDMNNTNWLVDNTDTLHIADTKSFVPRDVSGNYDFIKLANKWYEEGLIVTPSLGLPEYTSETTPMSVDHIHAFILGKNLYQYLTMCSVDYLWGKTNSSEYDFEDEIFKSPAGAELKKLIEGVIHTDPRARTPMKEVLSKLTELSIVYSENPIPTYPPESEALRSQKYESRKALAMLQKNSFDLNDMEMSKFIQEKISAINNAKDSEQVSRINEDIQRVMDLTTPPDLEILTFIQQGDSYTFASRAMREEALRIRIEIGQIPLDERNGGIGAHRQIKEQIARLQPILEEIKQSRSLLVELWKYRFGDDDVTMRAYINGKERVINTATTREEILAVVAEVNATLAKQRNPVVEGIRQSILSFRERSTGFFNYVTTSGMRAKASKMEDAMRSVAVDKRDSVLDDRTPDAQEVREALAARRKFKCIKVVDKEGAINPKTAADTYAAIKLLKVQKPIDPNPTDEPTAPIKGG